MKKYLLGALLLTFVAIPVFVKAATALTFPTNIYSIPIANRAGSSVTVLIKKTFTVNGVYALSATKPIYGLQISADFSLTSPDSLVRVILKDKSNKDYLVFEGSPSLMEKGNFSITNFCQETCVLNGVIPVSLKIEVLKGSLTLNSVFTIDSSTRLNLSLASTPQALGARLVSQQANYKISQLNALNTQTGQKWTAGPSTVCSMTYDQKKQLFKDDKGVVPEYLPNLQGFDCYKGGVFSVSGIDTSSQTSASSFSSDIILPDNYDWRNVNGENWMTSVKNQGPYGTCWAFGSTGTMEAHINLYYNKHINLDLSEQSVIECGNSRDATYGKDGAACGEGGTCQIQNIGIVSEYDLPYTGYSVYQPTPYLSGCQKGVPDYDLKDWKIASHSTLVTSNWTYDYPYRKDMNESLIKEYLITGGPLNFGYGNWGHVMVLVGYKKIKVGDVVEPSIVHAPAITVGLGDPLIGQTAWIFKNSWGSNWGDSGYGLLIWDSSIYTDPDHISSADMYYGIISPINSGYQISCVDKDNDNYCSWGISNQPPVGTTCPATCKKDTLGKYIKDCDDSKNTSGPFISSINLNCSSIREQGPWIKSAGMGTGNVGNLYSLSGERFSSSSLVYVDGKLYAKSPNIVVGGNGTGILFGSTPLISGVHSVYVWNPFVGTSNTVNLIIATPTTPATSSSTPANYRVTATVSGSGTISPSGAVIIPRGTAKTFTFTPATGYTISYLYVDGKVVPNASTYTFSNVQNNHTIKVSYKALPSMNTPTPPSVPDITPPDISDPVSYKISTTVNSSGSVSPSGLVSVAKGASKTFTFTPSSGYRVAYVAVDNQPLGTPSSYTFSNIQADHALRVTFGVIPVATTTKAATTTSANSTSTSALSTTYSQVANVLSAVSRWLEFWK